jgi:type VI secretion system protein ImpG
MAKVDDSLVSYYQDELRYLRNSGGEFAKIYPKIARRLELDNNESPDPHVERLLESFAFLTARISKAIDDRFPQTAYALLSVLYPHLINPLPSMAIASLKIDTSQVPPDKGAEFPKGTKLLARSLEGVQCHFQTVYNTKLWPITVQATELVAKEYYSFSKSAEGSFCLSITLNSSAIAFKDMDLDELVLHLPGDTNKANTLYEALFCENSGDIYLTTNQKQSCVGGISIEPVGFERDELSLPLPQHSLHHYLLFQEYFHFQEKFLFVRFKGLKKAIQNLPSSNQIQIVVPLKNPTYLLKSGVDASSFAINCTPIVNLFERPSDPLRINHKNLKYRLIPDIRRERTTEIYDILSVQGVEEGSQKTVDFLPYYSLEGHTNSNASGYWLANRNAANLRGIPGTDMYLSFVDRTFSPLKTKETVVTAKLLCTNRYLAEQLSQNALLSPEDKAPVLKIVLLNKPKTPVYSPINGDSLWMLISQLSANYLSILDAKENLKVIKELLHLFASRHPEINLNTLDDIKEIAVTNVTRRFGQDAWRGFIQGFRVNINIEQIPHQGANNLVLGRILHQYFSAIVHWNSFVETSLIEPKTKNSWMLWQPISGQQIKL